MEARFLHRSHREQTPGRRVAVHYTIAAPRKLHYENLFFLRVDYNLRRPEMPADRGEERTICSCI